MSGLVVLVLVLVLILDKVILQQLAVAKSRSLEVAVVRVMLAEFAEKKDDYNKFYEQFGKSLKLGIHVDTTTDGSMALCTSTIGASARAVGSLSHIPTGSGLPAYPCGAVEQSS